MVTTITLKKAYSEVDEFLETLGSTYKNQIPISLRNYIKSEKDINYKKYIDLDTPISNQNLMKETLEIIAFLNLKYWCKSEEEKQRLKGIYKKNEEEYEKKLAEKFDTSKLFNNKEEIVQNDEQTALAVIKENWITKLKKLISKIFLRNKI